MKKTISKTIVYLLLVIGALTMLLPFFWMVSTSFKTGFEALQVPPTWLPKKLQITNWISAWKAAPFATYLSKFGGCITYDDSWSNYYSNHGGFCICQNEFPR